MSMKEEFVKGTDFTVSADNMLICPCGNRVEDDGQCPNGHVSPMRKVGII